MDVEPLDDRPLQIAVVDDDARIGQTVAVHLRALTDAVRCFTDPETCLRELAASPADILVTDLQMPGMDGLTLLRRVREQSPGTEVVLVTGHADKQTAIQALRDGAFDFFEKPMDVAELVETVKRTARYQGVVRERDRYAEQVSRLSEREARRWGIASFVGASPGVQGILRDIRRLQKAARTSVLITGESGTGKELVARAIHYGGVRSDGPFVPVNCSAVPGELAESMLFGHRRGAFTGATADKKGCFEAADGGTVFLDEIGDMPAAIQIKLLRVLEDGIVVPVGESRGRQVAIRVVAATNADLQRKISAGGFRADLFYRLAGFALHVPPLRERDGDVALLAVHFADSLAAEMGLPTSGFSAAALDALSRHDYPGNVRELRNLIERALIESGGTTIEPRHLHFIGTAPSGTRPGPAAGESGDTPPELPLNLQQAEEVLIKRALGRTEGNVAAAARLLGINRTKLYRRMAVLGEQASA